MLAFYLFRIKDLLSLGAHEQPPYLELNCGDCNDSKKTKKFIVHIQSERLNADEGYSDEAGLQTITVIVI